MGQATNNNVSSYVYANVDGKNFYPERFGAKTMTVEKGTSVYVYGSSGVVVNGVNKGSEYTFEIASDTTITPTWINNGATFGWFAYVTM